MSFESPLPHGVFTANLTPLNNDLSVDYELLIAHCLWLLDHGSDGIALLGTTGEANCFTLEERIEMIEKVAISALPMEQLMVGTGCCAYPDTITLTRKALEVGIEGILLLPPFFYKQVDDEGMLKYFDQLVNGVQNDRMRIYLYHFPKMAGVGFSTPLIKKLIKEFPGIVVGMKDSTGDWEHMKEVLDAIPGFQLYAGTEKYMLDMVKAGGAGCISATANVTVPLAAKVYQMWKNGENADELNEHLKAVRASFAGLPFTGALKGILQQWTGMENWSNVRPPNRLLDGEGLRGLEGRLGELNYSLTTASL